VIAREGATAEQVRARMANQLPEEERLRRADFVIHNDGKEMLIPQVQKAIQFFS
jgi:dephospho-CoA kinase